MDRTFVLLNLYKNNFKLYYSIYAKVEFHNMYSKL